MVRLKKQPTSCLYLVVASNTESKIGYTSKAIETQPLASAASRKAKWAKRRGAPVRGEVQIGVVVAVRVPRRDPRLRGRLYSNAAFTFKRMVQDHFNAVPHEDGWYKLSPAQIQEATRMLQRIKKGQMP